MNFLAILLAVVLLQFGFYLVARLLGCYKDK